MTTTRPPRINKGPRRHPRTADRARPAPAYASVSCQIANARLHATTRRIVEEHFAEEQPALIAHPVIPYSAVLTVERRISHEDTSKNPLSLAAAC
jgi:hypothetical protein